MSDSGKYAKQATEQLHFAADQLNKDMAKFEKMKKGILGGFSGEQRDKLVGVFGMAEQALQLAKRGNFNAANNLMDNLKQQHGRGNNEQTV